VHHQPRAVVGVAHDAVPGTGGEVRFPPAQRDQVAVPGQQAVVLRPPGLRPVQPAGRDRRQGLGVRHVDVAAVQLGPAVALELLDPSLADGLGELGLGVVGEELPGGRGAPLLAHEEHRGVGRGQDHRGGDGQLAGREPGRRPVAERPVAHLVVVGGEGDEAVPVHLRRNGPAPVLPAERRPVAVVHEHLGERLGERLGGAEIGVDPVALAGDQGMDGVVDVVGPLSRHAKAPLRGGDDHLGVVQVRLRDQGQRPADLGRQGGDRVGQLGEQVAW